MEEVVNSELVHKQPGRPQPRVDLRFAPGGRSGRFTDSSVLITGESGTGKELLPALFTRSIPGPTRSVGVLDCTTVVPELSGSEFFGHERGAFTHAVASRDGAFALADGGSLFWMKSGTCRSLCRPNCCASSRNALTNASGAIPGGK